jgi:hypothetical protein
MQEATVPQAFSLFTQQSNMARAHSTRVAAPPKSRLRGL